MSFVRLCHVIQLKLKLLIKTLQGMFATKHISLKTKCSALDQTNQIIHKFLSQRLPVTHVPVTKTANQSVKKYIFICMLHETVPFAKFSQLVNNLSAQSQCYSCFVCQLVKYIQQNMTSLFTATRLFNQITNKEMLATRLILACD